MDYLFEKAEKLVSKYKTRNPAQLAELMGINLWYRPLGELKGFYVYERKSRYIVVNEQLEQSMSYVVIAHEMGHDLLHRELSTGGIRDTTMFLENNKTEREANTFAANLLISDKQLKKLLSDCSTLSELAYELDLPQEIVNYKLQSMNKRGSSFNICTLNNGFLA